MSKSILVIDAPENCCGCDLEYGHYCGKEKRYISEEEFESIPDWCPLRNLMKKRERNKYHNEYERGAVDGFNACIDEILKGANGNE